MKKFGLYLKVILAVIAVVSLISCAQDTASSPSSAGGTSLGSISGNVAKQICCSGDANYYDFQGADMELWQLPTKVTDTVTDANGDYLFDSLSAGTYDVVAIINEYSEVPEARLNAGAWGSINQQYSSSYYRMTKTAVTVAEGEDVTVDFRFVGY